MKTICAQYVFDGYTLHRNATIRTTDDGEIVSLFESPIADTPLLPGLVMPAFVNTHCHLELSHMKGLIPKHTGLVDFLLFVATHRSTATDEAIQQHMLAAEQAMLDHGIAAVGDISNRTDSLLIKQQRRLNYHTFVETFGLAEEKSLERFRTSLGVFNAFQPHMGTSLVLHAPYSISESLIKLTDDFNRNKISCIHNQECEAENEFIARGEGDFVKLAEVLMPNQTPKAKHLRSLPYMLQKLDHTTHLILVHNTATTQEDLDEALQQHGKRLFWCLCPNANLYIENKLPDVNTLHSNGCKITIGTDSLSSNDDLSVWKELCTLKSQFPALSWELLLRWSTLHGAEALNMDTQLGSLAPGKKPGILHLPEFDPDLAADPYTPISWLMPFGLVDHSIE